MPRPTGDFRAPSERVGVGRIEVKLRKVSQLFNTLDPSPFRESDLMLQAEDYIVGRALELPANIPIEIVIHIPSDEVLQASAFDIASAIKDYFGLRRKAVSREMGEVFKTGGSHSLSVLPFFPFVSCSVGFSCKG